MADMPQNSAQWFKAPEGPDSVHQYQLYAEARDKPDIFNTFFGQGHTALEAENYWRHLDPSDNQWGKYGFLRDAPTLTGDDLPPSLRPKPTPTARPAVAPPQPSAPSPTFQLASSPGAAASKGFGFGGGTQVDGRAFMSYLGSTARSLLSGRS